MELVALSAIALASAVNSAMPGPCVAMTIGRSAREGLRAGFAVSLGVIVANSVLAVVALLVMVGSLNVSDTTYTVMKGNVPLTVEICSAGIAS